MCIYIYMLRCTHQDGKPPPKNMGLFSKEGSLYQIFQDPSLNPPILRQNHIYENQ